MPHNITPRLKTLDVMTRNTNIYFVDLQSGVGFITVLQGSFNGLDGLIDVQYHTMLNTIAVGQSKTQDFQFPEFIFSSCNRGDFGGANV